MNIKQLQQEHVGDQRGFYSALRRQVNLKKISREEANKWATDEEMNEATLSETKEYYETNIKGTERYVKSRGKDIGGIF